MMNKFIFQRAIWFISMIAFIFPCLAYSSENCIKLVANKYCLGGSLSEENEKYKSKEKFTLGKIKVGDLDLYDFTFIDDNVFKLESAYISIAGQLDKVIYIKIFPNLAADGDTKKNVENYVSVMQTIKDKYCGEGHVLKREQNNILCDGGAYMVGLGTTTGGVPVITYIDGAAIKVLNTILNSKGY